MFEYRLALVCYLVMSQQDSDTQTRTLTQKTSSSSKYNSLNRAVILSPSFSLSTPSTKKIKKEEATQTQFKKLQTQRIEQDQNQWIQLMTASVKKQSSSIKDKTAQAKIRMSAKMDNICPICLCDFDRQRGSLECLHEFCFKCISQWCQCCTACPCCRAPFTSILKLIKEEVNKPIKETERIQVEKKTLTFQNQYDHYECYECGSGQDEYILLICDECDLYCCHVYCDPELDGVFPEGNWYCLYCRERNRRRRRTTFLNQEPNLFLNDSRLQQFFPQDIAQRHSGISSRTRSRGLGSTRLIRNLRRRVR